MRYCRAIVPASSCRRQPPRRVSPRNVSRLFSAIRSLLPGGGIDSLRLRLRSSMPGERGRRRIPKILPYPIGVNRPGASRPGTFHASLLPIVCYCRGSSHRTRVAATVAAGERPPSYCQYRLPSVAARLDTWTRAARLSTLRPLPPTPPFPHALSRSDQWPQCVGGRGLRSPLKRATVSPNPFTAERRF